MRVHVTDTPGATVLGNLTVTGADGAGFTTAYPCATGRPLASNNNFVAGQTIPNFVMARADSNGDLCVYTQAGAHLLWDQVGATTAFSTANAVRLLDTRDGARVPAGGFMKVHATDAPGATILGNLTVVGAEAPGYTTAYPCASGRPLASNNNYVTGETIPNFVAVRADPNGDVCFYTSSAAHLLWDQVGTPTSFATTNAVRRLDTRTGAPVAAGGTVAVHVTDTPGGTVLGNLTVVGAQGAGFTTAYPCASGRPLASNNNYVTGQTIPNFVAVPADGNGDVCFYTSMPAHLLWDQVGSTSAFTTTSAVRLLDTRTG
jgi:hypothetical protein